MRVILLLQIAATLSMTGLIWFVQIVHYPLFLLLGGPAFQTYEVAHAQRTGWVVGPLMCIELVAALLWLLPRFRPAAVSPSGAWLGAALVLVIWLSTGLLQVPLHHRLAAGFDAVAITRLVATNWIRTVAWTVRSVLLLAWTAKLLS